MNKMKRPHEEHEKKQIRGQKLIKLGLDRNDSEAHQEYIRSVPTPEPKATEYEKATKTHSTPTILEKSPLYNISKIIPIRFDSTNIKSSVCDKVSLLGESYKYIPQDVWRNIFNYLSIDNFYKCYYISTFFKQSCSTYMEEIKPPMFIKYYKPIEAIINNRIQSFKEILMKEDICGLNCYKYPRLVIKNLIRLFRIEYIKWIINSAICKLKNPKIYHNFFTDSGKQVEDFWSISVDYGNLEMLKFLLEGTKHYSADIMKINKRVVNDEALIKKSIIKNDFEIFEFLITNLYNYNILYILNLTVEYLRPSFLKNLYDYGSTKNRLVRLVIYKQLPKIEQLFLLKIGELSNENEFLYDQMKK
jgi:hypothetical protein